MEKTYFTYKKNRYGFANKIKFKSGFELPFWIFWWIGLIVIMLSFGVGYEIFKRFIQSEIVYSVINFCWCMVSFFIAFYPWFRFLKIKCEYATKDLMDARQYKKRLEEHFLRINQKNILFEIIKDEKWYMIYEAKSLKKLELKLGVKNLQRVED